MAPPQTDLCAHKGPSQSEPAPGHASDEEALYALIQQKRAEAARYEHGSERPIDAILAASLDRFADRTTSDAQIQSWANTILNVVADPELHRSIAERAARAVVLYGLEADVLRDILSALQRKRREKTLSSAGAYFHHRIRKECAAAGVRWDLPKAKD